MIIRELAISDFGIYSGRTVFDLTPQQSEHFPRPIVLFRGKNGVGKSTILEAIRLCLHGPLALGNRVSRADYYQYLEGSIHRPRVSGALVEAASVAIRLDHVSLGRKTSYEVVRSWRRQGHKIVESLDISSDADPLHKLSVEQREGLLRELISPHAADIFFFDNEKLHARAEDGEGGSLLTGAVGTLLGLDLVERLQRDLNTYLARQALTQGSNLNEDLARLQEQMDTLLENQADLVESLRVSNQEIYEKQSAINSQDRKIAGEGHLFSDRVTALRLSQQRLADEIAAQRTVVQELTGGLMPFAIAPAVCRRLGERINAEEEGDRRSVARQYVSERLGRLTDSLAQPQFWEEIGTRPESVDIASLVGKIGSMLRDDDADKDGSHEPILHLSDQGRQTQRHWIAQSLEEIPRRFCEAMAQLKKLETELKDATRQLSLVPSDDVLKPLVEESNQLHRELGGLEQKKKELDEMLRQLEYQKTVVDRHLHQVRDKLGELNVGNDRVQLAVKSQNVLEDYVAELKREKACLLETALVERFNDLCRKESFIEGVLIDPETFGLKLYRGGTPFDREKLSAGERQLLATAMMWALRDVSGLPFPVIIDTPFGRLDSDHHRNMINHYFPRAGQQVILLATNKEVDDATLQEMSPFISHTYELSYDPETGSTLVEQDHSVDATTALDEVGVQ